MWDGGVDFVVVDVDVEDLVVGVFHISSMAFKVEVGVVSSMSKAVKFLHKTILLASHESCFNMIIKSLIMFDTIRR